LAVCVTKELAADCLGPDGFCAFGFLPTQAKRRLEWATLGIIHETRAYTAFRAGWSDLSKTAKKTEQNDREKNIQAYRS
jgi:hypothetical protein